MFNRNAYQFLKNKMRPAKTDITRFRMYEGGSICNENMFITLITSALGFYVICQTKDQSVAVIMVQETLFYLSKFVNF